MNSFRFKVLVLTAGEPVFSAGVAFIEVSGIPVEMEESKEGGEHTFVHRLPRPAKHPYLVCKRGEIKASSELAAWAKESIGSSSSTPVSTRTLVVSLVDGAGVTVSSWTFRDAWPVKWSVEPFSAKADLSVESIEFAYSHCERSVPVG